jgi:urocanate hydratase
MMIMNNLSKETAQFPEELITYGGNGSVFSNWAQYHLTMYYLSHIKDDQTLILNSGHPQGVYPSHPDAPRLVISNGNMIPNYSGREDYDRHYALGNTIYGEMTAGSFCYIGKERHLIFTK